jgi:hypothetical protein
MRLGEWARTTKDVDIDWTLEENETVDLLQEAAALELEDLFGFSVERTNADLEAARLTHAIGEIFERRATHPVPNAVPVPPTEWQASWRKLVTDLPANDDVFAGHSSAAAFLDPVLCNELTSGTWDPDAGRWHPG